MIVGFAAVLALRGLLLLVPFEHSQRPSEAQSGPSQVTRGRGDVRVAENITHVRNLCERLEQTTGKFSAQVMEVQLVDAHHTLPCRQVALDHLDDATATRASAGMSWMGSR